MELTVEELFAESIDLGSQGEHSFDEFEFH